MQIRPILPEEIETVRLFLGANGWGHRIGSPSHFAQLIAHSQHTAVAFKDGQVVGFARGISDGLSNGYLSMVVVASEHRGQGIGRGLVQQVMGDDPQITWVLRAGRPGAEAFFEKLGFARSNIAMERPRHPA